VPAPFPSQPVQGFSALLDNHDGTFMAMPDNGYGAIENSADFELRVYRIRPNFETATGGNGKVSVLGHLKLRDPDHHVPFTITREFTPSRLLTGADFDIESVQRTPDGSLWFGDEFGPFLLHTDATGKVLEAPVPLPDFDNPGQQVRSPQNPLSEEATTVRIMNAVRTHALAHGDTRVPVVSPWHVMLDDGDAATFIDNRQAPPPGSGLSPASSEIFNVASLKAAGYPVVPYTVNDPARMVELMKLGVAGIISDRPDLLVVAARQFDANGDGTPGDFLGSDGLLDPAKFDAQGHRGGRDLRPENTLPAMEAGLDSLVTTLETDNAITKDGVAVLSHDPYVQAQKCRRTDGAPYDFDDEVLIKDLTLTQLQSRFICDKLFRGPTQMNDLALSPAAVAFAANQGLPSPYVVPSTQQLFDFVKFYARYYRSGAGRGQADASLRTRNAAKVRFNIETKINPRTDTDEHGKVFAERTIGPKPFTRAVAGVIVRNHMEEQADLQSFDFRTLLISQEEFPAIRTVYLFGDFPKFADPTLPGSDDGTNLQPQGGPNTPWMAGMEWPYRSTALTNPFRAARSAGFEGMAITPDGTKLIPLLEKPLAGGPAKTVVAHEFDIASRRYTGNRWFYPLEPQGTSIGDFQLFAPDHGVVIERDESQGDLNGFKRVYEVTLGAPGSMMSKRLVVDLLNIDDPHRISLPGVPGDVGLGKRFAFPFVTIESIVVQDATHVVIANDNNFPFSVGRHVGSGQPDDDELIRLRLERPLG